MISREYRAIRSQNDYRLPYRHYCLENQPLVFATSQRTQSGRKGNKYISFSSYKSCECIGVKMCCDISFVITMREYG